MRVLRDSRRFRTGIVAGIVATALATTGAAPAAHHGAAPPRAANDVLAQRSHSTLLDLYAIESQLARARATLAAARAHEAALVRERARVHAQQQATARALRVAQNLLAARVRALYEQGSADPLAVILGAESFDDAVHTLDALDRAAADDRTVIAATLVVRGRLHALDRRLARTEAQARAAVVAAAASASRLAQARTARVDLLASIARQRRLNAAQVGALDRTARGAETNAAALNATATSAHPAPAATGTTMTVTATGYSLTGRTATGIRAGWGVVAVDPAVIPLGTHIVVPGYGAAVAADTGPAIRGAAIDLWFASQAQARAWGRRAVTITLR